jgi:hypothetical protein
MNGSSHCFLFNLLADDSILEMHDETSRTNTDFGLALSLTMAQGRRASKRGL